jgi:hypothetical protein
MGIKCQTSQKDIDEFLRRAARLIKDYMLRALTKLGEESIVKVRNRGPVESWIDHTGNLRSSVGYSVYDYGAKYMQSSFATVLGGSKGRSEGMRMVSELAQEYSNVFALVVVAAMDYADYVEAINGKDVLESTRIWAQSVVEERLNRAKEEAIKVINTWKL